jgi:histone-lysine N-methyltransferase SETMAR
MKDVLLHQDNARPHTSLRTREAVAKIGWAALPHPAQSPDVAPSDYRLFDSIKNPLRGRHFAGDNELK